jgi:hypothetical protein
LYTNLSTSSCPKGNESLKPEKEKISERWALSKAAVQLSYECPLFEFNLNLDGCFYQTAMDGLRDSSTIAENIKLQLIVC